MTFLSRNNRYRHIDRLGGALGAREFLAGQHQKNVAVAFGANIERVTHDGAF